MSQFDSLELVLERGDRSIEGPLNLDMRKVYEIEARESETKAVTPFTANELAAEFSQGCKLVAKYLSWIKYEILKANEQLELSRATVILETCPVEAAKLVHGLKPNDAWREALIVRDKECQKWNDVIAKQEAVKSLLESKLKAFERAYYLCQKEKESKGKAPTQNLNGYVGMTFKEAQTNLMGAQQTRPEKPVIEDDVIAALKGA